MSVSEREERRWNDVSHVISSHYRVDVINRLVESPATPSRIASDSDNAIAHVSRALQELRARSLVELLVSEKRKKGRVYGMTSEGERLWETITTSELV